HNIEVAALSQQDSSVQRFSDDAQYGADIYFVNADQTSVVHKPGGSTKARHRIGFLTWELDQLPRAWDRAFEAYDEIWRSSGFCQSAISARSSVPVVRVPYCVGPLSPSAKRRDHFGIGSQDFVFLAVFDMYSCFDRKNPLGVIQAFKEAFPSSSECKL